MSLGFSAAVADDILDGLLAGTVYGQLHVGDPGASGEDNPAATTMRAAVTFGLASEGVASNSAAVEWTAAATETPTHISLWDDPTSGVFLRSGTISGATALTGMAFRVPVGQLVVSLPVAG